VELGDGVGEDGKVIPFQDSYSISQQNQQIGVILWSQD